MKGRGKRHGSRALGWLVALALPVMGRGEGLRVDNYFSEGCVLQRDRVIRVRGGAKPEERVEVEYRRDVYGTQSDGEGYWEVMIGPYAAGEGERMRITSGGESIEIPEVSVGDVWLCLGQSNMAYNMAPVPPWTEGVPDHEAEILAAGDEGISLLAMPRFVYHEPWDRVEGKWRRSNPASVRQFSAVAWYMGKRLREMEDVPVGMIVSAIGSTGIGSWIPGQGPAGAGGKESPGERADFQLKVKDYCAEFAESFAHGTMPPNQGPSLFEDYLFIPSGCYNTLVAPLTRYPVAGWVWYQGEANARKAESYGRQLEELVSSYRSAWQQPDSPFIIVQLPGWLPADDESGKAWADLREQQRKAALAIPRTALVVTTDVGDSERIHPREKGPVGFRCAEAAKAMEENPSTGYGLVPRSATALKEGWVSISFAGGSPLSGLSLETGFLIEVIYEDGRCLPAENISLGEQSLQLQCPDKGGSPKFVTYGYENCPVPAAFLSDGSPLSPFKLEIMNPE